MANLVTEHIKAFYKCRSGNLRRFGENLHKLYEIWNS